MIQTDAQRKKSQRERTAKHRAKVKEESANDAAANEQRSRDEFDSWRVRLNLVSPGECSAFVDAQTCTEALATARAFLIALNQPDVQPGETLLDVERRVIAAWCAAGAGLLNRNTLRIDTSTASTIDGYTLDFDTTWISLPGASDEIDVATLAVIEQPAEIVEVVDSPTVEVPTIEDTTAKELAIRVAAICKAQQDACDADARRISAKNLQRETEREKRLGVGYAYDVAE